jgi:transcriptional regulator with XRE-family HTH domain
MTRLRYERLRRQWSLQTLGFHSKVQGAEISKIERGILVPYQSQKERLAGALSITPEELLEEVDGYEAKQPIPVA